MPPTCKPIVTGIATIGLDHVARLGPAVEVIALHKLGIFKPCAQAFSVAREPGPTGPAEVLQIYKAKRNTGLTFDHPRTRCRPVIGCQCSSATAELRFSHTAGFKFLAGQRS